MSSWEGWLLRRPRSDPFPRCGRFCENPSSRMLWSRYYCSRHIGDLVRGGKDSAKTREPSATPRLETELLVAPIPSFSLDAVRSSSGVQKSPVIHLSGDERFFLLSFLVPIKAAPSYRYNVVVVREDETAVVSPQTLKNCDDVGNCSLICNSALFPTGSYEVRVTETGPDGNTTRPRFPFEIAR